MTYELECLNCEEYFTVELSAEQLADGGETITCPGCGEECEWEYDAESDTLELVESDDELEEEEEEDDLADEIEGAE